jgi:2,4-dienoyl-CoA reductase-like NADH-dependent reductase (Old Yellow Enzyme family)/thioredoxin reductase
VTAPPPTSAYPLLLSPWQVGPLQLRNRVILSPMTTGFGFEDGAPTVQFLDYMRARSRHTGLATVAFGAVHPRGRVERHLPEMWRDDAGTRLRPLVAAIHEGGGAASLQLGHGGRQVSPTIIGQQPVAPSPVPPLVHVGEPPHELDLREIAELIAAFAHAATQAVEAGFDAIELHGGHGYLIHQFLSPHSNRRDDGYGGNDVAARARFGIEVIRAVRAAAPGLALLMRINGDDLFDGGMTQSDAVTAGMLFADAGVHGLVVSAGVYGSVPYSIPLLDDAEATFRDAARAVRASVNVPVIVVGRITSPATAESLIAVGDADAVAVGRALLADPQWIAKAARGTPDDIRPCIATVQGCAGMLQHGDPISCSVNPDVGREHLLDAITPAPRRVVVVGGGVAGLEAARRAAELGHHVTLFEQRASLGGMAAAAATTPPLRHVAGLVAWFARQLAQLEVDLCLDTTATARDIAGLQPDLVILAVGAIEVPPGLDGYDQLPAWTASDALAGGLSSLGTRPLPDRVTVIGEGQRALATALWCADQGSGTTLLAPRRPGADTSGLARRALLYRLARANIDVIIGRPVTLTGDGVITDDGSLLRCKGIVLAEPLRPAPGDELVPAGTLSVRIGDARAPRDIGTAIAEARDAIDAHARSETAR